MIHFRHEAIASAESMRHYSIGYVDSQFQNSIAEEEIHVSISYTS